MKVVFDAERLRSPNSGLGQFCRALGSALLREQPADSALTFVVPPLHADAFGVHAPRIATRWWHRYRAPATPDVWHATHQDAWILPPRGVPLVLTIHDLNFLERPDYSRAKKARRLSALQALVERASAIASISEYTASVVREHLRVDGRDMRVIHQGNPLDLVPATTSPPSESGIADLDGAPFFLFVGVLHPKKNVHTLLPVLKAFPESRLVLAGPDGHPYARELLRTARSLDIEHRVLLTGPVGDATKRWLYERCEALLFPSLSEGFGLPPVEAMSLGKPVFLSRRTSLPEIGGDAARYFESFDPDEMAETIASGLAEFRSMPARRDEIIAHAARYSWTRAAERYWEMYASVV